MDQDLQVRHLGSFGLGIYGAAYSESLDRLLLGSRAGTLFVLNPGGTVHAAWPTPANRLWNLRPDKPDDRFVWASSYNGTLYKLDALTGEIVFSRNFGPGATTLISWLSSGLLAVGSLKKKVFLLDSSGGLTQTSSTLGGVCFVADLPHLEAFYVTDHDGRIWICSYKGQVLDRFELDVERNNPIWIAQWLDSNRIVFAWANGTIRVLSF